MSKSRCESCNGNGLLVGMLDDPCDDCGGTGLMTCASCGHDDADDATENGAYCLSCQAEMDAENEQLNHQAMQASEDEHGN